MASANINVRIKGELQLHLQQQVGEHGLYENASEYVRALIRNDLKSRHDAWAWLKNELDPGMRADESAFIAVTAENVIERNTTSDKIYPDYNGFRGGFLLASLSVSCKLALLGFYGVKERHNGSKPSYRESSFNTE